MIVDRLATFLARIVDRLDFLVAMIIDDRLPVLLVVEYVDNLALKSSLPVMFPIIAMNCSIACIVERLDVLVAGTVLDRLGDGCLMLSLSVDNWPVLIK